MTAHAWDCQQALYAALTASAALSAIVADRIYNDAQQTVEFPWIEIGDGQIIPADTSAPGGGDDGVSDFFDLHLWSRYAGNKENRQIADAVHTLLHGVSLGVAGRTSAFAWVRNVRLLRDPDGKTRHGVLTVEIIHRS